MIPKPLNEITWTDIEALRDSGREEDDMIEYKGSFSGGADFLAFNENQRNKAVDSIAKEAVAFLNGRGGDIIIGAKEAANDHPKIEAITPIANVDATADRLGQALAALIEPTQSVLGVRAVRQSDSDSCGVIVVRAPSSLRAPHRNNRESGRKDCYIRRGRQSVPMRMDEVQDVTILRRRTVDERVSQLEKLFHGFEEGEVRRERLAAPRFHTRIAFLPLVTQQIELSDEVLSVLQNAKVPVSVSGNPKFDTPLSKLYLSWVPTLRGRAQCHHQGPEYGHMNLISREIRQDGSLIFDFAWCSTGQVSNNSEIYNLVYADWVRSALAASLWSIRSMIDRFSMLQQGVVEVRHCSIGSMSLNFGGWNSCSILDGVTPIPNFEITKVEDIDVAFVQSQRDLCALTETTPLPLWQFSSDK